MNMQGEHESDELSVMIIDRLGERQRKLDRMCDWENRHFSKQRGIRLISIGMAVAACALALFVVVPIHFRRNSPLNEFGIEYSSMEEFRAASLDMAEIADLIERENYDDALEKSKSLLVDSDKKIREYLSLYLNVEDNEEYLYEIQEEVLINEELRWTCIYLLVKTERYKEAVAESDIYLEYKCKEHRTEVEKLLKLLKKE